MLCISRIELEKTWVGSRFEPSEWVEFWELKSNLLCIPKLLQNCPKSTQINPERPQIIQLAHLLPRGCPNTLNLFQIYVITTLQPSWKSKYSGTTRLAKSCECTSLVALANPPWWVPFWRALRLSSRWGSWLRSSAWPMIIYNYNDDNNSNNT